jgi:hypothetical protein
MSEPTPLANIAKGDVEAQRLRAAQVVLGNLEAWLPKEYPTPPHSGSLAHWRRTLEWLRGENESRCFVLLCTTMQLDQSGNNEGAMIAARMLDKYGIGLNEIPMLEGYAHCQRVARDVVSKGFARIMERMGFSSGVDPRRPQLQVVR